MIEGSGEGEKSWNRIFNEEPPLRCPLECLPRRPFQLAYKSTSFTLLHTAVRLPYKVCAPLRSAVEGGLWRRNKWVGEREREEEEDPGRVEGQSIE